MTWFTRSDQALLGVASLTSVGRFEDAVQYVIKHFPQSNGPDVIMQEARRLIRIEEKHSYASQPLGSGGHASASEIIQKMESMSQVHGVLAARDLLVAAGMDDQVIQILTDYKMWDELVSFSREHKSNLLAVLQKVAEIKREQGDQRGCAQLESELCVELFRQGASEGRLVHTLQSATHIYCELSMFEEAV